MSTVIDAVIVSVAVSAAVAFTILFLDKLFFEPRRWKRNLEVRTLDKALEIYGRLIAVLKGAKEKGKRQRKEGEPIQHRLESDDIKELELIFERKGYLLSDRLKGLWLETVKKDTYFVMMAVKHRQSIGIPGVAKPGLIQVDFNEMQRYAEEEYTALRDRYLRITGFKSA